MKSFIGILAVCVTAVTALAGPDLDALSRRADEFKGRFDAVVLLETTTVRVADSGATDVTETRAVKVLSTAGCREWHTVSFFYDPLTQQQTVTSASIIRPDGTRTEIPLDRVRTYPQPARAIYWPNIRVSIPFGLLHPGDIVRYTVRRQGFSYALLDESAGDGDNRFQPPMKGHFYDIVHFQAFRPVLHKSYSVELPENKPIQYRVYHGTLTPSAAFTDYGMKYTFTASDIPAVEREPHMVNISDVCLKLLVSTTTRWEEKSEWFYGVNEDFAFNYTEEIKRKVDELIANCRTDEEKIDVLNHWVAHYIRYSGLTMGKGEGYTLHPADMNYRDRQGVCKDKASMLIAMLRAAGFEAFPAMTMAGARIEDFPADHFNHCVVALKEKDGTFRMLDPTWVPWVREQWSSAEQEQQYLVGYKEGQSLKTTPYSPPEKHYYRLTVEGKLGRNGTLQAEIRLATEGQTDARIRRFLQRHFQQERDAYFKKIILDAWPQADIQKLRYQDPWDISRPMEATIRVRIPDYALVTNHAMAFRSPALTYVTRDPVNSELTWKFTDDERSYGFRTRCTKTYEVSETIRLPRGYRLATDRLPEPSETNGDYASLTLHADGNSEYRTQLKLSLKKRVYPPEAWQSFGNAIQPVQEAAGNWIVARKPGGDE